MRRLLISFLLAWACLSAEVILLQAASPAKSGQERAGTSTDVPNVVVQWNRILLVTVRTPGAQPATIHPTRSFAIMHAAIYDAVNAIDRAHKPYLVRLTGIPHSASQDAAAAAAAHDILASLYPNFQAVLDAQLQQSLAPIPEGADKAQGVSIGQTVAAEILALRKHDGSDAAPIPYVFWKRTWRLSVDATEFSKATSVHALVPRHSICLGAREPVSARRLPSINQ